MTQTSIAIPEDLLAELDAIADTQLRSRNSLIHWMLREKTLEYLAKNPDAKPSQGGKRRG